MQNILIQYGGHLSMITAIAAGGAVGAVMRHLTIMFSHNILGAAFPYGTLSVNIIGSFLMGVAVTFFPISENASLELRAFLVIGLLGGFTTFSAFSFDVLNLWNDEKMVHAMLYGFSSVIFSILAILIGVFIAKNLMA